MNERIKELAEQAEKYALDNVSKGHYGIEDLIYQFQFADTKMAKFAELIVKECGQYLNSPEFIGRSDLDWAMVLKEHFGVEE
jgi:hypothetical protein